MTKQPIVYLKESNQIDKNDFQITEYELDDFSNDNVKEPFISSPSKNKYNDLEITEFQINQNNFEIDSNTAKIFFVLWCGNFLCSLDGTIVSTTMNNIASDFNQSDLVTWIATSYLLTSTAFQPLYGKTSDILGRKNLLLFGQLVFTIGILLSTCAINVQTLALARAIAGVGGSGMGILTSIIISDIVPLSRRSVYVGYGNIVYSTAQVLGGPVGGICIVTIGWRLMFLFQVPFLLICIYFTLKVDIKVEHIPEDHEVMFSKENLKRVDIGGIITLNLSVSSIIFLFSNIDSTSRLYKGFFTGLFIISTIAYILIEKYVAVEKLIDQDLLKGEIGVVGLVNGINSLALYMILFITPLYLQIVQDISVTNVGYYTMFFVTSTALGSLISGYIIRRNDQSEGHTMVSGIKTSLGAFLIQALGFFLFYFQISLTEPASKSIGWRILMILELIIGGLGVGGFGVGVVIFIVGKVGRKKQASANTVVSLIRSLGNVLGVSLSLSSYSNSLSKSLHSYFTDDGNKKYVISLIKDSSFIRNGLPEEYIHDVLNIYKKGLMFSFYPALSLSVIGLGSMYLLYRSVRRILH